MLLTGAIQKATVKAPRVVAHERFVTITDYSHSEYLRFLVFKPGRVIDAASEVLGFVPFDV